MAHTRATTLVVLLAAALVACNPTPEAPRRTLTSTRETTAKTTVTSAPSQTTSPVSIAPTTTTTAETTTTSPRPRPPEELYGTDWERLPGAGRAVALTFDAGANDAGVASILATLAREHVPATFFLTGAFVDAFPESARAMSAYRIGNHSVSHPYFTTLTDTQMTAEITEAADRIRTVTGADPMPWFRFPFGDRDVHTIAMVNSIGYVPIRWTVDTLGWKGTSGGQSAATVQRRVLDGLTDGEIVLMHIGSNPDDGTTLDADALPGLIQQLRDRGYAFVTLDAMLEAP